MTKDSLVIVECRYVEGSKAQGCFIELTFPNGTQYLLINASKAETAREIPTSLPAHCYDVQVYDWESDGRMGDLAIPASSAVWNDFCLAESTPPSSASGIHHIHLPLIPLLSGWLVCLKI